MNHRSPVSLAVSYAQHRIENQKNDIQFELDSQSIAFPFDFWDSIEMHSTHTWFDDYVYERLNKYPMKNLRKLDIWDDEFLKYYNIKDQRTLFDKMIHRYFHQTNHKAYRTLYVRVLNTILKRIYKS